MTKFCPKCGRSTPEEFCIVHGDVTQDNSAKATKLRKVYLSDLKEKRAEKMPKQRGKGWHKEPVRHQQASLLGYMRKGHYQATTLERKPATIQRPTKPTESDQKKKPTFTVLANKMTKTERTLTPKFIRGTYTKQPRLPDLTAEIKKKVVERDHQKERQKIIDKQLYDSKPAQARAYNAGLADAEAGRPTEANLYTMHEAYRRGYKKGSEKPQPIPRKEMGALLKESRWITDAYEKKGREQAERDRQNRLMTTTLDVIKGFEREYGTAKTAQVLEGMVARGYTEREAEKGIEKLKLDGHIFEPKYDIYKST